MSSGLSIVIPTHERPEFVVRLLQSLQSQSYDFNDLEVFVVMNFLEPRLEKMVNPQFEKINLKLLSAEKKGANAARNLGIESSKGKIILLLDDDILLDDEDYLQKIVNLHSEHKSVSVIGGGYKVPDDSTDEELAYNIVAEGWQRLHRLGINNSSRLVGGNVSYKSTLFQKVHERFNEDIEYGGSESEFHRRLEGLGVEMIYLPQLKVNHKPKITIESLIQKARKQALSTLSYDIDRGDDWLNMKSYQKTTQVWALKEAKNKEQYQNLILLIDLYDWTYQKVLQQPEITLRRLKWLSYFWIRKKKKMLWGMNL